MVCLGTYVINWSAKWVCASYVVMEVFTWVCMWSGYNWNRVECLRWFILVLYIDLNYGNTIELYHSTYDLFSPYVNRGKS